VRTQIMAAAVRCEKAESSEEITHAFKDACDVAAAALKAAGQSDDAESAWLALVAAQAIGNAVDGAQPFVELYANWTESAAHHRLSPA
jgi:transcriptional regulator of nitric oxide reductase